MSFDKLGPTGNVVRGSVLDVNKSALERKLRDYDSLLYITWNPKKRSGMGSWEVRRRPEKKTALFQGTWNGITFLELKYDELDIVNHVLDVPILDYSVVTKIKEMDTWNQSDWVSDLEYKRAKYEEQVLEKSGQETRYMIKQHKREIREFQELVLSGFNPARIAQYWGRSE